MIRGFLLLASVGLIPWVSGCQTTGGATASTSKWPAPTSIAKSGKGTDPRAVAQASASSPAGRTSGYGKPGLSNVTTADAKRYPGTSTSRQPGRVPTVSPSVHSTEPDPEIPAGVAGTQPQPNLFERVVMGKKEPAKRMPLPQADYAASQQTNDELFGGP